MITLKSKFYNFVNKQGKEVTNEDLDNLKQLISTDIINFRGNISYGFTPSIAKQIIQKIDAKNKNIKICIINDTTLHMLLSLLHAGFKLPKIYVAIGKWQQNGKEIKPYTYNKKEDKTYKIFKKHVETSFNEKIKVISLEEIFNMKFDLIIANPPYGKLGAKITDTIKTNITYDQFINLLPANDYKRVNGLHNYVKDLVPFQAGSNFADAYVTTHLAEVCKAKVNDLTQEEFERQQYIDPSLNKYFEVLYSATHYAIDNAMYKPTFEEFANYGVERSIYIGKRDPKSEHLPYSKKSITTRFNLNQITSDEVIEQSAKSEQKHGRVGDFYLVGFNTTEEKDNCTTFLYSADGFRFISKVFVALNIDSSIPIRKWMPKVDWTRAWTVEEILADYGYTETEIAEVIADLDNFKDMERD
jgi:hypothetical protein